MGHILHATKNRKQAVRRKKRLNRHRTPWLRGSAKSYFHSLPKGIQVSIHLFLVLAVTAAPVLPSINPLQFLGALSSQASTAIWDGGGADAAWSTKENWLSDIVPGPDDIAVFNATSTKDVIIDTDVSVAGIEIQETYPSTIESRTGKRIYIGTEGITQKNGTFINNVLPVEISGDLNIEKGSFIAPSNTLTIKGNLSVFADGSFEHNNGSVILNGNNQIIFGSITFFDITKLADIGQTLQLSSGRTVTIEGTARLKGSAPFTSTSTDEDTDEEIARLLNSTEGLLQVHASKPGEPAIIDLRGSTDIAYLHLRDIINTSPNTATCRTGCVNAGNVNGIEVLATIDSSSSSVAGTITSFIRNLLPGGASSPSSTNILQYGDASLKEKNTSSFTSTDPAIFIVEIPENNFEGASIVPAEITITGLGGPTSDTIESNNEEASGGGNILENAFKFLQIAPQNTSSQSSVLPFIQIAHAQELSVGDINAVTIDPTGQVRSDMPPTVTSIEGQLIVEIPKPTDQSFRPGAYILRLTIGGANIEHTFTWGSLLVNIPSSTHTVGQSIGIGMAVLNDFGHTTCNANLSLTASLNGEQKANRSTQDNTITRAKTCGRTTVTNEPDYVARFTPDEAGIYTITASTDDNVEVTQTIEVVGESPVLTSFRNAPTRIKPTDPYTAEITIRAKDAFSGSITEAVPDAFTITDISNNGVVITPPAGGVGGEDPNTIDEQTDSTPITESEEDSAPEEPSPTPTPQPTPVEIEPTVTPTPEPTPQEDAEDTEELAATPTPSPTIEPSATLTPQPTPVEVEPTAIPTPEAEEDVKLDQVAEVPSTEPETSSAGEIVHFAGTYISWDNLEIPAGESITLSYSFDAPTQYPRLYTHGPLGAITTQEPTRFFWQEPFAWHVIADDQPILETVPTSEGVQAALVVRKAPADSPESFGPGDIVDVYNIKRLLTIGAQKIINPRHFPVRTGQLRTPGTLLDVYQEQSSKYKVERISKNEIIKTDLTTGQTQTISEEPNEDGEYMDVPLYISRQLQSTNHLIFGTEGEEYWYGGKTTLDIDRLNTIWDAIESQTEHRRNQISAANIARVTNDYLVVPVTDFTDNQAAALTANKNDGSITEDQEENEAVGPVRRQHRLDVSALETVPSDQLIKIDSLVELPDRIEVSFDKADLQDSGIFSNPSGFIKKVKDSAQDALEILLPGNRKSSLKNSLKSLFFIVTGTQVAHAATVTTSIGSNDRATDITAVSGSGPYTVTVDDASDIEIGDALMDEHATPRKYLITNISSNDLTVVDSEGIGGAPDDSGTSAGEVIRYYSTITLWETDLDDTGIYASSDDAVGEAYNDATFDESVTIDGGGTVGLASTTLTAPEGERHNGTAGTGARIDASAARYITLNGSASIARHISWIEVDENDLNTNTGPILNHGASNGHLAGSVRNMIIHDAIQTSGSTAYGLQSAGFGRTGTQHISNNFIFNIQRDNSFGGAIGFNTQQTYLYNNTIHNIQNGTGSSTGVGMSGTGLATVNNLVTDSATTDFASATNQSYNASSDGTAAGTGSITGITTADQYVSTTGGFEDLHLKAGADAIDAGTDLGTSPTGVEIDIDGYDRDSNGITWDIGADESAATYTWTGAGDGTTWESAANWDQGHLYPSFNAHKVVINTTSNAITTSGAITVGELEMSGSFTGTLTLGGSLTIDDAGDQNGVLTLSTGTLVQGTGNNLSVDGTTTIGSSGSWLSTGGDVTLGGNVSNAGYVHLDGGGIGCGDTDDLVITGSATWSGAGTYRIYDVDASDQADSSITAYSSTDTSGNTWTFNGTCPSNEAFWIGAGGDENWNTTANWDTGATPGSSTTAIFGPFSTKDADINVTANVSGMQINLGYTGTITQNTSIALTVGTSNYTQHAGTFMGGDSAINLDANLASFNLTGGTFTSTSGTMEIDGTFTHTGGTFTHNSGTVLWQSSSTRAWDVPTTETFYNFTINGTHPAGSGINLSADDVIVVENTLNLANGSFGTGTIEAQNGVTHNALFDGGTGLINITGATTRSIDLIGDGELPAVTLNAANVTINGNTSGTTTFEGEFTLEDGIFTGGAGDTTFANMTLNGGVFTAPSGTMTIDQGNVTQTAGTFNHNNSIVVYQSSAARAIDVATTITFYDLTINGTHASTTNFTISGDTYVIENDLLIDGSASLSSGTLEAQGDVTYSSSLSGSFTLSFTGTNNQTYTEDDAGAPPTDITINKPNGTVHLASNADWNATSQDVTVTSGTLATEGYTLSTNILTVSSGANLMMDGNETLTASTKTFSSGSRIIYTGDNDGAGDSYTVNQLTVASNFGVVDGIGDAVGYWKFDEGSDNTCAGGEDVCDSSGNGDHGTNSGDPTWTSSVSDALSFTNDYAIDYDGTGDYTDLPDNSFTGPFSFSYWFKTDDNTQTAVMLGEDSGAASGNVPKIGMFSSSFFIRIVSSSSTSVALPTQGAWNHVTITRDGLDKVDLYVNGGAPTRLFSNAAQTGTFVLDKIAANGNGSQLFTGQMDDLRVYDKALSPVEVGSLASGADLTTPNEDTFTLGNNLDVNSSFGVGGGTFAQGAYTLNIAGDTRIQSGATFTKSSNGSALTLDGDLLFFDGNSTKQDLGDIEIGTSPDTTDLTSDMAATSLTINDGDILNTNGYDLDITNDITIAADGGSGGGLLDATDDGEGDETAINLGGSWDASGTFTADASTVTFDGTSTDTVTSSGNSFYNLAFNGSSGIWDAQDATDIDNALTIADGTFDINGQSLDLTGATFSNDGRLRLQGGETLTSFTNDTNSGTIEYDSTSNRTGLAAGDSYYDLDFNDGLVGYWKFDEGVADSCSGGEDACDSSGNGVHATWSGADQNWVTGASGISFTNPYAMDFNGTSNYATLNTFTGIDGASSITMSVWINSDNLGSTDTIFRGSGLILRKNSNDELRFSVSGTTHDNGSAISADTWYHITAVHNGATVGIYVNGTLVGGTSAVSGPVATLGTSRISHTFEFWDGLLDDLRIYNRALSSTEITALAAGNRPSLATYTLDAALDVANDLTIGHATLTADTFDTTLAGDFLSYGSLSAGTGDFILDGTSQTLLGETSFYDLTKNEGADDTTDESLTFEANTTFTVTNNLTLNGRDDDDRINVQSSSAGSNTFVFDVTSGNQSVDYLELTNSESSTYDIVCLSCNDGGGNDDTEATPHWIFRTAGNLVFRGTVYSDEGSTALGDKTVTVAVNGTDNASTETNTTTGAFSIDGISATGGDVITIYLEDEPENAVTVTVTDGTDTDDLDLYQSRLITRQDNGGSLTNANLSTATVSGEADITDVYTIASGDLTIGSTTNDPVAYWKFDEGIANTCAGGGDACDSSGNGRHGTWSGSSGSNTSETWTTDTADVNFTNSYAMDFDGTDDMINVSGFEINSSSIFTLSAWVKTSATGSIEMILNKDDFSAPREFQFRKNSTNFLQMARISGGSGAADVEGSTNIADDTWHHVVTVLDGTYAYLYVDGVSDVTPTAMTLGMTSDALQIGHYVSGNDSFTWNGGIDDVRIYDRALSANEVRALAGGEYFHRDELFTPTSHTFAPGGDIDVGDVDINGTLTMSSNNATVSGSWDATSGSYSITGQTLFTGDGGSEGQTITSNGNTFGGDVVVNDSLVGYWKMDESANDSCAGGEDACDSSGNGNHGVGAGASGTNNTPQPYNTSTADLNFTNSYARDFDGTDDNINIEDLFTAPILSGGYTISTWIYADSLPATTGILSSQDSLSDSTPNFILQSNTNTVRLYMGGTYSSAVSLATGEWHNITIAYAGNTTRVGNLYIDGHFRATVTGSVDNATSRGTDLTIGNGYNGYFNGRLDDVRFYDRALSADAIALIGAGNQPETGVVTYTLEDALDVDGDLVLNTGTLDTKSGEDNAISLVGGWENNGGIFTANSGTVTLDGTSTGHELQSGGQQFNNLTISGAGGGWTLGDSLTALDTITQSNGALNTSSDSWDILTENYTRSAGTLTSNSSRLTLDSTSSKTLTLSSTLYDLDIGDRFNRGLSAYWAFDEGSDNTCSGGQDACDTSGEGNHGTFSGSSGSNNLPQWTAYTAPTYNNSYALDFDGTDDLITIPNSSELQVTDGITISAWVRSGRDGSYYEGLVSKSPLGLSSGDYDFVRDINNKISLRINNNAAIVTSTDSVLVADGWTHVAATYDRETMKLFIDGSQDASTTSETAAIQTSANSVRIGHYFGGNNWWDGLMDNVRVYSRALTSDEIATLANGTYTPMHFGTTNTYSMSSNLDVNNDLTFNDGTLSAGSFGVNLAGDWNNYTGGTSHFTAGTSTISFDGTDQAINGSNTFNIFSKIEGANDSVDETLTFEATETQTITDTWTLTGRDDNDRINLRSSIDDTQWLVDPQATRNLTYLDVADSNNINASAIVACDGDLIEPENNNTNWDINNGLAQNDWRWYVDTDDENVTDPWPSGSRNLAENTLMTVLPSANDPMQKADEIRARINMTASCAITATSVTYKLQYTQSNDCTDAGNSWSDVGAGGGGSAWRYASSSESDGAALTVAKLASTDVLQNYVKSSSSSNNANAVNEDENMEWDFHIEHNGATDAATYCFRAVESDGTVFDSYNSDGYPTLQTKPGTANLLRHGNTFIEQVEQGATWAD